MNGRFDIIGDIHGHADELHRLLAGLGYARSAGAFRHPEGRQVIFLGDFIDRGPKIREVLETVRAMVDVGDALAILGNHEVNALRYNTLGRDGRPLRAHSEKNRQQHIATLDQFDDGRGLRPWLEWFAGLPLSLELDGIRAVHASWDDQAIAELKNAGRLEGQALESYSRKESREYDTISLLLNGPEAILPDGHAHETADGAIRRDFRVKWWENLGGLACREAVFPDDPEFPDAPPKWMPPTQPYPPDAPPVFFGHYALKVKTPARIRKNVACLDYGTGKGGFLCAYRWDGEREIDASKFVDSDS